MTDEIPVRFSDEQAKAILARAIEIDARAPMTTVADLRVLAAEIGVSPESLETALREQIPSAKARHLAASQHAASRLAAFGMPLGVLAGWALGTNSTLPLLALMGVGLLANAGLALYQSASGSLRTFQFRNLVFWGGALAGSLASLTVLGNDAGQAPLFMSAAWCVRSWIASGILGTATVLAVRRSLRADRGDGDGGAETGTPATGRWARLAKRIDDAIFRPLRSGDAARAFAARG